jgi:tetraacyldisaccharide 4'-kinase
MPKFLFYLLIPFSWLYGLIISFRKWLYKSGLYTRSKFDFPIICVGNITAGGTGKTPHIEWLIKNLSGHYRVAVLSRGYKRKTIGYVLSTPVSTPEQIGDEPYQIKQKFLQVPVAVSENRVLGIPMLLGDEPNTEVVLMDDGFQHLSIQAGFNIVLCDYNRPYYNDYLLPAGLLRENKTGANRADVIIVTKCPSNLSLEEKNNIKQKLKLHDNQTVYFSTIKYKNIIAITDTAIKQGLPDPNQPTVALAGIAKANIFINQIKSIQKQVIPLVFSDHQTYTDDRIQQLAATASIHPNSVIITTEKDAVKLKSSTILPYINQLPIWYIPIGIEILFEEENQLLQQINQYIKTELENAQHENS